MVADMDVFSFLEVMLKAVILDHDLDRTFG